MAEQVTAAASAMRYHAGAQRLPPGGDLYLPIAVGGLGPAIGCGGSSGLQLGRGSYLVSFVSDARCVSPGEAGAVLTLNGAELPYAASSLAAAPGEERRIVLSAILNLIAGAELGVRNGGSTLIFRRAVLSAVKLA